MVTCALQQPSSTCVLCWPVALGGISSFFLIQELGLLLAACGFSALIPQQWGVGILHLHSGYAALAKQKMSL